MRAFPTTRAEFSVKCVELSDSKTFMLRAVRFLFRFRAALAFQALLLISTCSAATETSIEVRAADGTLKHPLSEIPTTGARCAVFFFYLHDCPICNAYAPEIGRICADYAGKGFTFYIVQTDAQLSADAALKHARDYALPCPILMDGTERLARKCGASITPQVAIVNAEGAVVYVGRIDDLYADYGKRRSEASVHDLRDALTAIIANKAVPVAKGVAVGCFIPFNKPESTTKH